METIRLGGRPVGFGVGIGPQSTFVKSADQGGGGSLVNPVSRTMGAFVGGAVASGIAGVVATSLFGDGTQLSLGTVSQRLQRNWRVLAATAVAGGIIGAVAR